MHMHMWLAHCVAGVGPTDPRFVADVQGLARRSLPSTRIAVVVPICVKCGEATKLIATANRWTKASGLPCMAAAGVEYTASASSSDARLRSECEMLPSSDFVPRPGRMQDLANGDISADLIIYQEMEFVQRATAMRLFGRAAACFRNLAVVTAHLAHEDDSYPRAPNVMFYQLATELLKLRAYSYWVQLETDSVPLRPRWLEYLAARIPPRTDGFWVKGSAPRHHCSWCNLEEGYHINGNALYNARDEAFLAFIQRTWSFAGNHTEPYDVALFERARSSDRSTWTMLGGKSVGRLFQFSDVIVSYYWPIAFERAVRRYPCAVLLHGNHSRSHNQDLTSRLTSRAILQNAGRRL